MAITAVRSVNQAVTETVQKRYFVGPRDILIDPDLTPLFAMTTNVGNRRKPTNQPRVEWVEDDYVSVWGAVSNGTTNLDSVTTNVPVADVTLFAVGDLVAVPKSDSSSAVEEVIRVTAVAGSSSGTITVTRNIGGAGADTIGATAGLRILSPAQAENAGFPSIRSTSKVVKISYTQIFRRPIKVSRTLTQTALYGAMNDREFQQQKAMQEHKRDIEQAGLWSRASESLASPGSIRTTMGLKSQIASNVTNGNTTLTETGFLSFSEGAFKSYAGPRKVLLAAPKIISALDFFSDGKLRTQIGETVFGVTVRRYVSSHGEFLIVRNRLMDDEPGAAGLGYADEAYAIDLDAAFFAPLAGNGDSSDTQLLENVIRDGTDGFSDEWLTEGAWGFRHEKRHARLYNVTAFA